MKKGQKYLVRCCAPVKSRSVGLGSGTYQIGEYVTDDGSPTKDQNKAYVYVAKDYDFPFEDIAEFSDCFEIVPVIVAEAPFTEQFKNEPKIIPVLRLGQDNPRDQIYAGIGAIEGNLLNLEEHIGSTGDSIERIRIILRAMKLTLPHIEGMKWNPDKPKEE